MWSYMMSTMASFAQRQLTILKDDTSFFSTTKMSLDQLRNPGKKKGAKMSWNYLYQSQISHYCCSAESGNNTVNSHPWATADEDWLQ